MSKVMKSSAFVSKAKKISKDYKTLYVLGCFGAPMNTANKKRYTSNNTYNASATRKKKINSATADTFGFDCVCLIKGILWGWNGDKNATYGGAKYCANGVPDFGSNEIMKYCTGVSKNFKKIEVGEIVHMDGHVGIYIGDGLAVECTPIWKDGVQITAVGNIGSKKGYNTRTWVNHGKLNYIDYTTPAPTPKVKYYPKYTGKSNSLVDALKEMGIDSSFKHRTKIAKANSITLYLGTAKQNTKLLTLLKQGKCIKPAGE